MGHHGSTREEAALFEVNYGSEETPITASGPHTKVGGNPATDRRPHATSPIDIALGRRRDVQQNLFPDGERQERDKRDKSMDRVAGLLGALPRPRHSAGHHTQPDKNLFEHDEIEFAQWILGMEPAEEIVNQLRREPISGPLWKELVTNGAGQLRETAAQDIQSLWPKATRYFIIRLMSESRNHLVQLQQQAEAEKGLHTREVMAIHFPPMPTAAGADDRLIHEQLKAYKSSLIAKLQDIQWAETYAQQMEEQFDHPDQDNCFYRGARRHAGRSMCTWQPSSWRQQGRHSCTTSSWKMGIALGHYTVDYASSPASPRASPQ